MKLKPEDFDIKLPRYNDFIFENPINEEAIEAFDESRKLRERSQQAQIDSAKDISDMKNDMQIVISNQQSQLERQEKIIEQLLSLNDVQSEQLDKLKKLCEMLEEGDNLDKEYKEEIIILLNKKIIINSKELIYSVQKKKN